MTGEKHASSFLKTTLLQLVQYCTLYMFKCHGIDDEYDDADDDDDDIDDHDDVIVVFIVASVA